MWAKEVVSSCQRDPFCSLHPIQSRPLYHDSLFCESLTPNIFDRTESAIHTKANIHLTISLRVELCWLPRSICACSWDESSPERCAIAAEKLKRAPRVFALSACVWWERKMKVSHGVVKLFSFGEFFVPGPIRKDICVDECGVCGMGMKWIIVCQP
jgi:hypothetical protein